VPLWLYRVGTEGHPHHRARSSHRARYAISHLAELGHRKIAFIKGQTFSSDTTVRWEAIRKVCVSLNIRVNPELVVQLEGMDPGSEPAMSPLKAADEKGAFYRYLRVQRCIRYRRNHGSPEAGLHVPAKNLRGVFDDIPTAATIRPALTTCASRSMKWANGRDESHGLIPRRGNSDPLPDSILVSPTFVSAILPIRLSQTDASRCSCAWRTYRLVNSCDGFDLSGQGFQART